MFLASKFAICTALSEPILRIRTIETLSFSIVLHKITGFAGHNNENKMKMSEFVYRIFGIMILEPRYLLYSFIPNL